MIPFSQQCESVCNAGLKGQTSAGGIDQTCAKKEKKKHKLHTMTTCVNPL